MTCLIAVRGPNGIENRPYNCVFAFMENEPVVLAAKPFFTDLSKVEPFQLPSWVLLTHADFRLTLGFTEIYLNIFCGALMDEVCTHPLSCSFFSIRAPEESLSHSNPVLSISTDS